MASIIVPPADPAAAARRYEFIIDLLKQAANPGALILRVDAMADTETGADRERLRGAAALLRLASDPEGTQQRLQQLADAQQQMRELATQLDGREARVKAAEPQLETLAARETAVTAREAEVE